jgi:hypothetical protein
MSPNNEHFLPNHAIFSPGWDVLISICVIIDKAQQIWHLDDRVMKYLVKKIYLVNILRYTVGAYNAGILCKSHMDMFVNAFKS